MSGLPDIPRKTADIDLGEFRPEFTGLKLTLWVNPTRQFLRRASECKTTEEQTEWCAEILGVTLAEYMDWLEAQLPLDLWLDFTRWLFWGRPNPAGAFDKESDEPRWTRARAEWRSAEKKPLACG